jgi:amidase
MAVMAQDALWKLDATAQAALVRTREVTAADLVDAAIARIEALNPHINAVITRLFDSARQQARDGNFGGGPFAGVPMLLKDACIQVEGTPYYIGTRLLRDAGYRSTHTTELANRFRRAGFIFLGKTNVPELSSGITTEPRSFGATRNPWDVTRSVGGSSGGSAAAVASGMISIAHGSDGTGSLRYPAACCGVVRLKPSRGRVPTETPSGDVDLLRVWMEFVLARSVRDLAGILDAVGGPADDESFERVRSAPPNREAIGTPTGRLSVGLMPRDVMTGMSTAAECVAAVERTGRSLESLGHDVELSHPPVLDGLLLRIFPHVQTLISRSRSQLGWLSEMVGQEVTAADLDDPTAAAGQAAPISGARLTDAINAIVRETRPAHDWWASGHDILVTPTLRQPPWPLGLKGGAADAGIFPSVFSFTGQPALSLPLHGTPEGLPVGVQIVAAYGRDDLLLRVAAQLEAATPWADRWPATTTAQSAG